MSNIVQNITITLFGLEQDLWGHTEDSEKSSYSMAMLCFLGFLLISCISSIYLLYLISGSVLVSFPAGLIVTLIIGSVVRFSLIILRRSIYDEEKSQKEIKNQSSVGGSIKNEKVEINGDTENKTVNIVETNQSDIVPKAESTKKNIKKVLINFITKFKKIFSWIKWPNSRSKVPLLAGLIRFIIISVMGLLVLFPFAALLHHTAIEDLNENKRAAYVAQFEKDAEQSLHTRISLIEKEIESIQIDLNKNAGIYQTDGLIKEKKAAILRLKDIIENEKKEHEANYSVQLEHFREQMDKSYFISMSFMAVMKFPFFFIATVVISILLIYPHLLLYRLKTKKGITYSKRSTEFYRKKIDNEYKETEETGYTFLKKEYGYDPGEFRKNIFWENPPYCTKPREIFIKRNRIGRKEFLSTFELKSSSENQNLTT